MLDKNSLFKLIDEHVEFSDDRIIFKKDLRKKIKYVGTGLHKKVYKFDGVPVVIKEGNLQPWSKFAYDKYYALYKEIAQDIENLHSEDTVDKFLSVITKNHNIYQKIYNEPLDYSEESLILLEQNYKLDRSTIDKMCSIVKKYHEKDREYPIVVPQYGFKGKKSFGKKTGTTYYLIQEYVEGTDLSNLSKRDIPKEALMEIGLRTLIGNHTHATLPDFRPALSNPFKWFHKTENIRKTHNDLLVMLDSDWVWKTDSQFFLSGAVIPDLIVNSVSSFVQKHA